MGIIKLLIYVGVFVLGFVLGIIAYSMYNSAVVKLSAITGNAVDGESENYTWTTAICNSNNECMDVLVECSNGEVVSLSPITNLTSFGRDWNDFRDKLGYCK